MSAQRTDSPLSSPRLLTAKLNHPGPTYPQRAVTILHYLASFFFFSTVGFVERLTNKGTDSHYEPKQASTLLN